MGVSQLLTEMTKSYLRIWPNRNAPHQRVDESDMPTGEESASMPDNTSETYEELPWVRWEYFVGELGSLGGCSGNSCPTSEQSSPQMPLDISDDPDAHR